jgi:hypothetical protein
LDREREEVLRFNKEVEGQQKSKENHMHQRKTVKISKPYPTPP